MGTATEKLRFLLDVTGGTQVVNEFEKVGKSADKNLGTVETKFGKVGAAFTKNAGLISGVTGVVGAVGLAALSAANRFNDLALEAGKFGDATGLSVQDASRWIEVTGDMGVSADSLETALGRLGKTIATSPAKFAEFGVEVQHSRDGIVDVNATFLTLIDRLNAITDPARRAQVASELLGRGWQDLAEIIGTGSSGLVGRLNDVADVKVITPDELAKAKAYRAEMDALGDAVGELALSVGETLVPIIGGLAEQFATIAEHAKPVLTVLERLATGFEDTGAAADKQDWPSRWAHNIPLVTQTLEILDAGLESANEAIHGTGDAAAEAEPAVQSLNEAFLAQLDAGVAKAKADKESKDAAKDAADAYWEQWRAAGKVEESQRQMKGAVRAATEAIKAQDQAWQELTDTISDDDAWLNLQDQADATWEAIGKAFDPKATEQDIRDGQHAINDMKQTVIGYGREVLNLPDEHVTNLLALIDEGKLAEVEQRLAILTRNRNINIGLTGKGALGYTPRSDETKPRASGGPVAAGDAYIVGERGPELLQMGARSGHVIPNHQLTAGGTDIIQVVLDGRVVAEAVRRRDRALR